MIYYIIAAVLIVLYFIWFWKQTIKSIDRSEQIIKLNRSIERSAFKLAVNQYIKSNEIDCKLDYVEIDKICNEILSDTTLRNFINKK